MTDYERFEENQGTESRGGGIGLALAFLLIGVGAGAIAALLLAPQSGKRTRRTLRRKYEDAREVFDDLKGQAGDALERGTDWVDNAKEKVAPIARKIRH